jgi:glycosyltransferase involved in cell wall biosynthesis
MKIVFVSYSFWPPDFGGELLASVERFQSLAAHGCSTTVLTSGRPQFASHETSDGLKIRRSPVVHNSRPGRALRHIVFWFWVALQLVLCKADVVHFGSIPGLGFITSDLVAFLLCGLAKCKRTRTVTVHSLAESDTEIYTSQGWSGLWRKLFYRTVGTIVAVSPALYRGLAPDFGSKVLLIPCGIRDNIFTRCSNPAREDLRSGHKAGHDDVVFAFLGSVGRRKGFDVLANAFAELAPTHPRWRLWVIGPRTRVENQNIDEREVAEVTSPLKDLQNRVKFWGRLDVRHTLSRILSASDVFVFPSRREGMGIAPMEAMAVGVPVVVSRIPGVTDLANVEGETGLYVPPGDLAGLKAAMLRLGTDEELRKRMGARAAQVVREGFAWEQHVTNWMKLYEGDAVTQRRSHELAMQRTLKS